jgi:hypothetical protein
MPKKPIPSNELKRATRQVGTAADYKYAESMAEVQARAMTAAWSKGATYAEIAEEWQVTPAIARIAVERALADSLDDFEDRAKQRTRLNLHLNSLMKAVTDRALDKKDREQPAYVRLALLINERYAKLNGLDAPTEHILHTPDADELDQWVAAVVKLNGGDVPEEGDPFDLEENEETGVWE